MVKNKLGKTKIILSVFLTLVILTSSIYLVFNGNSNVKIDIQKTRTQYYVGESGDWILAASEYVNLFDGTTKMRAKSRDLSYWNNSDFAYVQRNSTWKHGIITTQTYKFKIENEDITQFPSENTFECYNCEGKIVHYEIRDILYNGETKLIDSPFSFGHNMKIEWQNGAYFHKVYQQKSSDKIIVKYKPQDDYEIYKVRLFDPPIEGNNLIIANGETVTLGGNNDTYDTVWVQTGGTLNINSTDKYLNLTANNITIDGTVDGTDMYDGGAGTTCASSSAENNGGTGSGLTPGGGGDSSEDGWFVRGMGGGSGGNARDYTQHYSSSCNGHYYYDGEGGGFCGAFDTWKSGGSAGIQANSSRTDYNFTSGSGGGGGGCQSYANGGAGGKGAGIIIFNAPTVNIHGIVNLAGSTGNSASASDGSAGGGGGGSGGSFGIFSNQVNITDSTISVSSANGGAGATTSGAHGTSGGTSSGGRIKIFYNTFENTSTTITLGTDGSYYTEQTPMPIATLEGDNNYTTANLSAYCNNTYHSYGENNYSWYLYKDGILNQSGITNETNESINVYNISSDWLFHNETWKLTCGLTYGSYETLKSYSVKVHQPIWISIFNPFHGNILNGAYWPINYSFENYTNYDSCWFTNDSGVTNQSMTCGVDISHRFWEEGSNTITIYSSNQSTSSLDIIYDEVNDSSVNTTLWKSTTTNGGTITENTEYMKIWSKDTATNVAKTANVDSLLLNYLNIENLNITVNLTVTKHPSCNLCDRKASLIIFGTTIKEFDLTTGGSNLQNDFSVWYIDKDPTNRSKFRYYDDGVLQGTFTPTDNNLTIYTRARDNTASYWSEAEGRLEYVYYTLNDTREIYSDSVIFTTVLSASNIDFTSPTPDNATWLNKDYLEVSTDISNCESFKNVTYYLRSLVVD